MGIRLLVALIGLLSLFGFTKMPEIRDLREISQDHRSFTVRQESEFSRLDPELQKKADAFQNALFFSPWHQIKSRYTLEEVKWEFDKYDKDQGYGRNGKKHRRAWMQELTANAQLASAPQKGFPAITLRNTDLRVLPTSDAHLSDPNNCVLPFDNLQNSSVAADTPIFVSHVTKDKKWILAETHYAMGWLPARHIASAEANFVKEWERGPYAVITKDKTPIVNEAGKVMFTASLGSFFPIIQENDTSMQLLIAAADNQGKAFSQKVLITKERAANKPLPLTPANMARIANELMNEPYGWGGLDQKRDCSSTLMDLFAPFGIWLPRTSGHQAQMTGAFIDFKNLSPAEKEETILKQGIPYFSLLWLKGHIMLYIGKQDGQALAFHNFWSVKTRDANGKTGKKIIGRSAITTLRPGQELRKGKGTGDILPGILGMTLIWPPTTGPGNAAFDKAYQGIFN
jgi:cell wall-associated NlpC family hydrolase